MKRQITLAMVLLLAVAMLSVSTVDARRGRHVLKGMARGICTELTDEQRTAIHDKVVEMREDEATREKIRMAVAEMLEGFGVDAPEEWFSYRGNGVGYYFCADLTDEQRTAIHDKVVEMREAGATREKIRTAVAEMLEEFGVELPEDWAEYRGIRGRGIGLGMRLYADMAMIDAEIQAAPAAPSVKPKLMSGTWASLKQ